MTETPNARAAVPAGQTPATDQTALDHVRGIARRLANHAVGFQDVLDDSDRDPWAKTVGADITALAAALDELAAEPPLSPDYQHPECGFNWHGRDGMDIPMRDGQPVCPRCEIERLHEKHKASLRRADQINNELMEEVQRYADGTERPVLWSVYNEMHLRAADAELTLDRIREVVRRLAAHAVGFQDVLDESDRGPWGKTVSADIAELSRLAAASAVVARRATDEDVATESVIYEVVGDWGVDGADSAEGARSAVAKWLRAYPKCGAFAQQRIVREWPDGSEFYGPWTDIPAAGPAVGAQQPKEIQCADAFWPHQPHPPHGWQQGPDTPPVRCPGITTAQQPKGA